MLLTLPSRCGMIGSRGTASARQTTRCGAVRRSVVVQARAGGQPFNEGASQVKRLINRDRKEFLGNEGDILEKFETEFGAGKAVEPATSNPFTSSAPATPPGPSMSAPVKAVPSKAAPVKAIPTISGTATNPFKPAATVSPFGVTSPAKPFKQSIEPRGLTPEMSPDPLVKETPIDFLKSITLTQVLIVMSFTLIILLMIGTFAFVYKVGGVRLQGIE